jgi:hypothetical protein
MFELIDDNPYSAPLSITPPARPKRTQIGPVVSSLIAIAIATYLLGPFGFLVSMLGVGSWWVFKHWPRKANPEDAQARAYLQKLENPPITATETPDRAATIAPEESIDALRDLRL